MKLEYAPFVVLVALSAVAIVFPAYATEQEDEGEQGECKIMDASNIGEGWQRKVCPNPDEDSFISPSGEECFANPEFGTSACGNEVNNPDRSITP